MAYSQRSISEGKKKKRQVAELLVHLLVDKTQQPKSLKPGFVPVLGG